MKTRHRDADDDVSGEDDFDFNVDVEDAVKNHDDGHIYEAPAHQSNTILCLQGFATSTVSDAKGTHARTSDDVHISSASVD